MVWREFGSFGGVLCGGICGCGFRVAGIGKPVYKSEMASVNPLYVPLHPKPIIMNLHTRNNPKP